MKNKNFIVQRYDADEGKVFEWKKIHTHEEIDENGEKIIVTDHLYAKILYIGDNDSIENYKEIPAPIEQ